LGSTGRQDVESEIDVFRTAVGDIDAGEPFV
jgi:hypothetical protein